MEDDNSMCADEAHEGERGIDHFMGKGDSRSGKRLTKEAPKTVVSKGVPTEELPVASPPLLGYDLELDCESSGDSDMGGEDDQDDKTTWMADEQETRGVGQGASLSSTRVPPERKSGKKDIDGEESGDEGEQGQAAGSSPAVERDEDNGDVRIITLNVRGLGPTLPHKFEALKQVLFDLRASVAVITESHLNAEETKRLVIPGYTVDCKDCREDTAHGGVFIAVRQGVAHKVLPKVNRPLLPINACSMLVYPTGEEDYAIRITGVYLPPPPTVTVEPSMLDSLTEKESQTEYATGGTISHLIVGDFNQNSWKGGNDSLYHEWITEAGMWELSDPSKATHQQGSALDKFLLLPGRDIPENLLPWGMATGEEMEEGLPGEYYPAYTYPFRCIADHHPVLLTIPGRIEQKSPAQKQLKIRHLTPEEWSERNARMQEYITEQHELLDRAVREENAQWIRDFIFKAIRVVFADKNTRARGPSKELSPFKQYCRRHLDHPDLPLLIKAEKEGNSEVMAALVRQINRESWRDHLSTLRTSDTKAHFGFLAREDGRKPRVRSYSCSAPLQNSAGVRCFGDKVKCGLLADFFEQRFNEPKKEGDRRQQSRPGVAKGRQKGGRAGKAPNEGKGKGKGKTKGIRRWKKKKWQWCPPPGYRKQMTGEFSEFREVEVVKAASCLKTGKAPGPDGVPAEVFQKLTTLWGPLRLLFNCIMRTGVIPVQMLRVYLVPLDKPGRDPELCSTKRPISLICAVAKILEALVHHRLLPLFEPNFAAGQYAYRRERGTEMHMLELFDAAAAARARGDFVYLASVDVDGAFDTVPHDSLIGTFEAAGIDSFTCRYLHTWLVSRQFQVRLMSARGVVLSTLRGIGRGLPQGGVLSPFMWLVHFNKVLEGLHWLRSLRGAEAMLGAFFLELLFADDIVCLITHPKLSPLKCLANITAEVMPVVLAKLGLRTTRPKSMNFITAALTLVGPLFRRQKEAYRRGVQEVRKRETDLELLHMQEGGEEGEELSEFEILCSGLPYQVTSSIKILGVIFDRKFSFTPHIQGIMDRAKIRLAILQRLAGCTWGAETNLLRLTGEALVTSLLRYGLAVTGSGAYEQAISSLDVGVVNIMARKIAGVGCTARLVALHAASGVLAVNNLYVQHCAGMVDASLRAENSTIQARVSDWLGKVYGLTSWKRQTESFTPPQGTVTLRLYRKPLYDFPLQEVWYLDVLSEIPSLPSIFKVNSVYHTYAKEAEVQPHLREASYSYQGVDSWRAVGLQILHATGWRPDCAMSELLNTARAVPPADVHERFIVISKTAMCWHKDDPEDQGYRLWTEKGPGGLHVSVGSFFQGGIGASCASVLCPDGTVFTQGWVLGEDSMSTEPPDYILESSVYHALSIVLTVLKKRTPAPTYVSVRAGSWRVVGGILKWFNHGTLGLTSAAASGILTLVKKLLEELPCPLILRAIPKYFFDKAELEGGRAEDVILTTAERLYRDIVPQMRAQWGGKVARIPWNKEELKSHLESRYRRDEKIFMELLRKEGSVACEVFWHFGLDRNVVKRTLKSLQAHRPAQVALGSLVCATRFKYYDAEGQLLQVRCPFCGERDSFKHLLECRQVSIPPQDRELLIEFLRKLALRLVTKNPGRPDPVWPALSSEVLLGWEGSSSEEISLEGD